MASARFTAYRSGRTFLHEGDPPERVFLLLKGAVKIFHRARTGAEVTVKLFRAPVIFGEMEVIVERPFLEYARTMEPCEILELTGDAFRSVLSSEPGLTLVLTRDLADRLCITTSVGRALAFADVPTRLANVLLDYVMLCGERVPEGMRLDLRISQEMLAADLAASRRSVAEALDGLKREGILGKTGGRYVIHDLDRLQELSSRRPGTTHRPGTFYRVRAQQR